MKKQFYFLIAAIGFSGTTIAQQAVPVNSPAMKNNFNPSTKVVKLNQKDFENPLFESDFSEELGTIWIVNNENASPAENDDWVVGTDVPSGPFAIAGINSTTAENGFAMFDSDGYCANYEFPYPSQNASIQTANPVDLSPAEDVSVQFETNYRNFQGQAFFEFSTDGVVWISRELFTDLGVNDGTDNGELFTFFVPELSGVDEAFMRFRYQGACDYAWMIDDFKVAATPEFDIRMTGAWYDEHILLQAEEELDYSEYYDNLEYSEYLQGSVRPLTFVAEVENLGTSTLTGVTLQVTVNTPNGEEVFTSEEPISVESFDFGIVEISDVTLDAFADGGVLGDYTVNFSVFVAEEEGDLSNNTVPPKSFQVNDIYMANDRDLLLGPAPNFSDDVIWGSQFLYKEATTIEYIAFGMIDEATFESAEGVTTVITTMPGELLYLNIRQGSVLEEIGPENEMDLLFGDTEIEYVIEEDDITVDGPLNWIIVPLPEPLLVEPDVVYQAEITLPIVGEDFCLIAQVSQQEVLAGTILIVADPEDPEVSPQGWNTLGTEAPALRLGRFGPASARNQAALSFSLGQNYPNPIASNGSTRIGWELQVPAENITFTVSDNTGKTIYQRDLGDRPAGIQEDIILDDLNLAAGVYQYGLKVGNDRIVRKMVITK
ncbi:MAG: T9SS type A sorting domain-containing protein [Cryomorphaceae bacterium]